MISREVLLEKLQLCVDDPMWPDHVEMPKQLIRIVIEQLTRHAQCAPSPSDCDWPDELFTFRDDPGEHDPCYVVMPGGAMLSLNHHAKEGVDIARARFIIDACNDKLKRDPWEGKRPNPAQALTSTVRGDEK